MTPVTQAVVDLAATGACVCIVWMAAIAVLAAWKGMRK